MKKIFVFAALLTVVLQGIALAEMLEITDIQIAQVIDPINATNYRLLLKANLPALPVKQVIDGVACELSIDYAVLKFIGTVVQLPAEKPYVQAVVLAAPWSVTNPSWEVSNKVNEQYRITDLFLLEKTGSTELRLDITDLIRGWIIEGIANSGLVLRSPENLPSLLNSSMMIVGTAQPRIALTIYFTYNPKQ
jgi:hypothetical protein